TFTKQSVRDGRKLAGTSGLGCINCHNLAGRKSLGIPAVDLATAHERLNPGWFMRFLDNPIALNKNTRMPALWPNGVVARKDIADGKVKAQQEALWNYLSLGESIPMPAGMAAKTDGKLLVPGGEPVVLRTFVAEAGPRGIAIGFPARLHVSFDANVVRLVNAWKGDFFDPFGAWSGRKMKFNGPAGVDILKMPPGPSFAKLESATSPWPDPNPKKDRHVGGRFKGYRLDKNRAPILMYELAGVRIEEQPLPNLAPGGATLLRRFNLSVAEKAPEDMVFLAASGEKIVAEKDGVYRVDQQLTVTVNAPGMKPRIRKIDGESQLIVPVRFQNNKAQIEVDLKW
ncbi:MAG: hypothetical protein R3236_09690, partial [Phycisphaeraceae bacterium]|nr:hypothetical protein [Phycisphaeraceae bacterium]